MQALTGQSEHRPTPETGDLQFAHTHAYLDRYIKTNSLSILTFRVTDLFFRTLDKWYVFKGKIYCHGFITCADHKPYINRSVRIYLHKRHFFRNIPVAGRPHLPKMRFSSRSSARKGKFNLVACAVNSER